MCVSTTVRSAGELLGLSPPAAPREIVPLQVRFVNAYSRYSWTLYEVGARTIWDHFIVDRPNGQTHPARDAAPDRPRVYSKGVSMLGRYHRYWKVKLALDPVGKILMQPA